MTKNIRFEDWEAEQMHDPEFRAAVEELEPIYQVTRLRIMRGLTQAQLAELVGTMYCAHKVGHKNGVS